MLLLSHSDDEGSETEEDDDEEDDDEENEEVEEQEYQSSSLSVSKNSTEEQIDLKFDTSTPTSSKSEIISGLSNMIAKFDFNHNSSVNSGLQTKLEVIYVNFNF